MRILTVDKNEFELEDGSIFLLKQQLKNICI